MNMKDNKMELTLDGFAGGALLEKFQIEMMKVVGNLQDPNTDYKKPREVNIKIKLVNADEDRNIVFSTVTSSSKTVPSKDIENKLLTGRDMEGNFVISEYRNQIPGQLEMDINGDVLEKITPEEAVENTPKVLGLYK